MPYMAYVIHAFPAPPSSYQKTEARLLFVLPLYIGIRQRLIFPARLQASIVSAEGLNFCVRNGNRWIPFAMATGNLYLSFFFSAPSLLHKYFSLLLLRSSSRFS